MTDTDLTLVKQFIRTMTLNGSFDVAEQMARDEFPGWLAGLEKHEDRRVDEDDWVSARATYIVKQLIKFIKQ